MPNSCQDSAIPKCCGEGRVFPRLPTSGQTTSKSCRENIRIRCHRTCSSRVRSACKRYAPYTASKSVSRPNELKLSFFKQRTSDRARSCDLGHGKTCSRYRASNHHGYRTCTGYRFPRDSNHSSPTLTQAPPCCRPAAESHRSSLRGLPPRGLP